MDKVIDLTQDDIKVNYALDDRIITIKCTDGDLEIPVYNAIKSQSIKNYIEMYDANKDGSPFAIRLYFTKEEFNTALKPHMCKIEDFLLLPKKVNIDDIYDMNGDKLNKFINSTVITVNKLNDTNYYGTVELNTVKHKFNVSVTKLPNKITYNFNILNTNDTYYGNTIIINDEQIKGHIYATFIKFLYFDNNKPTDFMKLFV